MRAFFGYQFHSQKTALFGVGGIPPAFFLPLEDRGVSFFFCERGFLPFFLLALGFFIFSRESLCTANTGL